MNYLIFRIDVRRLTNYILSVKVSLLQVKVDLGVKIDLFSHTD